jgi:hypothetical protein
MTADAYVEHFVDASAVDRMRMQEAASAPPAGITTLLDAGCGLGPFLRLVRDMGESRVPASRSPRRRSGTRGAYVWRVSDNSTRCLPDPKVEGEPPGEP